MSHLPNHPNQFVFLTEMTGKMPSVSKMGPMAEENIADLLKDKINLNLLKNICSGNGLDVNLSYLSRHLKRHRNSIRERVRKLLKNGIIDRPIFPFFGLFMEYPLLVSAYADLPDNERVHEWLRNDRNVFATFRVREGEYNTMLFEFHKSVWHYLNRKGIFLTIRGSVSNWAFGFLNILILMLTSYFYMFMRHIGANEIAITR